MFGSAIGSISTLSSKSDCLTILWPPTTSYGYSLGKYNLNTRARSLNSSFKLTYILLWIADIVLLPLSNSATVVPTAACWFPSPTCISAIDANLWPADTTTPISCRSVCDGSLNGKAIKASLMLPPGASTSLNSPGWIAWASSLILIPRILNPAGRLESVPASNNDLRADVAVLDKPPIMCIKPKP